jgi:hypothetical protein
MNSRDDPSVSLESGKKLLTRAQAKKEVKRLNTLYTRVAEETGFAFRPDADFIREFTDRAGGNYFHQFRHQKLPAPLEMFYSHEGKKFSLGMNFWLVPEGQKDNVFQKALTRLVTVGNTFSRFNTFLEGAGYSVLELTGSVNCLDYTYRNISARDLDDVEELTRFLHKVRGYLAHSREH